VSALRPLQNRVDPFGELVATTARGALMGNRGGRFHNDDQTLGARRWTSPMWIACVCEYKGVHREVWGKSYTELFFLDEPTALAAGHRPCFLCRNADAKAFQRAFDSRTKHKATEIDKILHQERLIEGRKRIHSAPTESLPDGVMIERDGRAFAVRGKSLLPWSFGSYGEPIERPRRGGANVLTPPSIVRALLAGFAPRWNAA
jgi:hypothetical protein